MSYTLCMIFFLTAGLHFSDSVEAGMFILIYFCLIFAQKSETSSRAAHFSLSTVTAYPFLFEHRDCEPCCRLPCEHHSRAHPWLPPPRYGQPGPAMATGHCPPLSAEVGAVPGLWGRAGKVSFLFSFFWGKLPWGLHKRDGEQQADVLVCSRVKRAPLCLGYSWAELQKGPSLGHHRDKAQASCKSGRRRTVQSWACLCILISLWGFCRATLMHAAKSRA